MKLPKFEATQQFRVVLVRFLPSSQFHLVKFQLTSFSLKISKNLEWLTHWHEEHLNCPKSFHGKTTNIQRLGRRKCMFKITLGRSMVGLLGWYFFILGSLWEKIKHTQYVQTSFDGFGASENDVHFCQTRTARRYQTNPASRHEQNGPRDHLVGTGWTA